MQERLTGRRLWWAKFWYKASYPLRWLITLPAYIALLLTMWCSHWFGR